MKTTRSTVLAIAYMLAAFGPASGQSRNGASEVTAIDILLATDEVMMDRAKLANDRLRADFPNGFALDATRAPTSPFSSGSSEPATWTKMELMGTLLVMLQNN